MSVFKNDVGHNVSDLHVSEEVNKSLVLCSTFEDYQGYLILEDILFPQGIFKGHS